MKTKNIIISGGAGFIGVNLTNTLLKNKHNKIICIDNFSSSTKQNISHFINNKNYSFIEQSISKKLNIKKNIDEIYNLACVASPLQYQKIPLQTIETNTQGLFNLLNLAKKNNAKFLQASTSEIYGNPTISPQSEEYTGNVSTISSRACYDEGKRISETITHLYNKECGVDTKIVRIFNTYGPYLSKDDGRVVSNLILQALSNKPLTIYGDGEQTRSFCYVDDTVNGLIKLMASDVHSPVNIGNPHEITINELATTIADITQSSSVISYGPPASDDPVRRCPDISKANKLLNWKPIISLNEGLLKTINYFENNK